MVSTGLTALASSGYDLSGAVTGKRSMKILCVGHGGGSLPLFLASKIKGKSIFFACSLNGSVLAYLSCCLL